MKRPQWRDCTEIKFFLYWKALAPGGGGGRGPGDNCRENNPKSKRLGVRLKEVEGRALALPYFGLSKEQRALLETSNPILRI